MSASLRPFDKKLLLGRYRVVRLLGEGGMGTVYLARVEGAEGFTRPVVVKRMRREIRGSDEGNRLFIREAKILSKMQHPAIVGIVDFGIEDDAHIMVLDYVHGYTLSPWLEYRWLAQRPLPVDICLFIVRRILDALHYAHHFDTEEGQEIEIVHRDVAPDNVLLSHKGYVHLLDFGVASMRGPQAGQTTQAGVFRGKLCYGAPETIQGQSATPRSDQYSAAVLLLELLTLETPFNSDTMAETVARMVNEAPAKPSSKRHDVPEALDRVLLRALAKRPEDRFDSALTFSRELRQAQVADDDEIASQLQQIVHEDFERLPERVNVEGLKARDAALARILSAAPNEPSGPEVVAVHIPPLEEPLLPVSAAAHPTEHRQLRRLLWGLLVVGGVIALGLGATIGLLSRTKPASDQQVVIVGGERSDLTGTKQTAASTRAVEALPSALPKVVPGEVSLPEPSVDPRSVDAPTLGETGSTKVPRSQTTKSPVSDQAGHRQRQLAQAVQQQSGAYQACFTEHLGTGQPPSEAVLHFSVAETGGVAQVEVEPPAVAATPLGNCLGAAARRVEFPALDQPVSFRVPVRARAVR